MTVGEVEELLLKYKEMGVRHIVALRGDIPSGIGLGMDGMRYANELVELIKNNHGDDFHIEVAAYPEYHPQARSAEDDINNFVRKAKAGADSAITQYFLQSRQLLPFCRRCAWARRGNSDYSRDYADCQFQQIGAIFGRVWCGNSTLVAFETAIVCG